VPVDINRFDVDAAGNAVLVARWQVYDRTGQGPAMVADETFVHPAAGRSYEAYAAAMSAALADLAGRIADSVDAAAVRPVAAAPKPNAPRR
jgi:uncharacterized lipoprotein YmbA